MAFSHQGSGEESIHAAYAFGVHVDTVITQYGFDRAMEMVWEEVRSQGPGKILLLPPGYESGRDERTIPDNVEWAMSLLWTSGFRQAIVTNEFAGKLTAKGMTLVVGLGAPSEAEEVEFLLLVGAFFLGLLTEEEADVLGGSNHRWRDFIATLRQNREQGLPLPDPKVLSALKENLD